VKNLHAHDDVILYSLPMNVTETLLALRRVLAPSTQGESLSSIEVSPLSIDGNHPSPIDNEHQI
jgi:hypothetical protein